MHKQFSALYLIIALVLCSAAIIAIIGGCDEKTIDTPILGPASGSGPIGGGESQNIHLSASPSTTVEVLAGEQGKVEITARIENNIGQPMPDGQPVIWSSTIGSLSKTTDSTSNGTSSVTLTFPKDYSGCSTVSVRSGDATASIRVCTKTIPKGILVESSNSKVDHGDDVTVTATVLKDGAPEVGVQVEFSVSGAGALVTSSTAITDASGKASVIMRGNNTSGADSTATVTAKTSDGRSGSVSIIVESSPATPTPTATAGPTATPAVSITLTGSNNVIASCAAGNTITLTAHVQSGGAPLQNALVTFSRSPMNGGLSSSSSITDNSGNTTNPVVTFGGPTNCPAATTVVTITATASGQSANFPVTVNP